MTVPTHRLSYLAKHDQTLMVTWVLFLTYCVTVSGHASQMSPECDYTPPSQEEHQELIWWSRFYCTDVDSGRWRMSPEQCSRLYLRLITTQLTRFHIYNKKAHSRFCMFCAKPLSWHIVAGLRGFKQTHRWHSDIGDTRQTEVCVI